MKTILSFALVGALALMTGCGGSNPPAQTAAPVAPPTQKKPIDLAAAGSVAGKVFFSGAAPERKSVNLSLDKVCSMAHTEPLINESLLVNTDGTLRNAVVYVKSGLEAYEFPESIRTPMLDQQGCVYRPHVLTMRPGKIQIRSQDATLHNVRTSSKLNKSVNVSQSQPMTSEIELTESEIVKFQCDVHPWMSAYAAVIPHPKARVIGEDGSFTLSGLPDGTYEIEAWHETLGVQSQTVKIENGATVQLDFTFKG